MLSDTYRPQQGTVTMFTTPWCGYCIRLKRQLAQAGVVIEEVDIEQDPGAASLVMAVNQGNQTVPTVLFSDGSTMTNPPLTVVLECLHDLGR